MRVSSLIVASVAIVAFFSCISPLSARTLEASNSLTRQLIQSKMRTERIPAVQVAVIKDGHVVMSEVFGWANVENRVQATRQTRFPINSATKAFTGVAVIQLVETGNVALDAPISRYLRSLPPTWQDIRVRQLLGHTSGLPDMVDEEGDPIGGTEMAAWAEVSKKPVDAEPGTRFAYNQTNYVLLSMIIAKQSGMPFDAFVSKGQFARADMPASTFGDSYDLVPNAATIYATSPRGTSAPDDSTRLSKWIYAIPYGLWAGGGIQTTADEVARWLVALSNGRLIKRSSTDAMWLPEKLNDGNDGAWGAGWVVLKGKPNREIAAIGGARAAFFVYPDDGLAVVVLTNLAGAHPQRFIPEIAAYYR